jgi:hypothetical protein
MVVPFYGFPSAGTFSNGSQPPQKGGDPLRQQGAASALDTPLEGGGLKLSVPMRGQSHDSERWKTVRYALDSNARTFRLCLILLW